ncbi:histidine kinase [Desulfonema ishimotonii]|uniref:histidine kinase n=1 Tax=Desulfonema ishimotonii TaxID=45657 RepID=A0A401FRI3_9BACT|nr:ATP-binding protein [Desulfonema ishimotonii]GBC59571.1 histidine kinase [Desulfonema ishimotonii]
MWYRLNLSVRIYIILTALVLIPFLGGMVMVWYTYRMEGLMADMVERDTAAFETAQALETALVNQKGFVSYYFLDGNPDWLQQLGECRQIFRNLLDRSRTFTTGPAQKEAIDRVESEYNLYVGSKDQVIDYYMAGRREAGGELHREVRQHFFKILELCEEYKNIYKAKISHVRAETHEQARHLRVIAGLGMALDGIFGVLLIFVLVNYILGPVRRLAEEADRKENRDRSENEITALSRSVRGLIEDVDQTHSELEKSREHLLQAEKMAMVGKLAAGMAHSIRNPFTSVKMRLFSLSRTLEMSETQKEDFDVISEEIRHVDTIVQNFLEFSRPPKLRMQQISPSTVVDMALQLLAHRLKSYDVTPGVNRKEMLPAVAADPEQLKEVLVNLIINACESMEKDQHGNISIHEQEFFSKSLGHVSVIRVSDDGSGIPEAVQEKIFQPFFTTKEDGTGLGLSIAARIIRQHGGLLEVKSIEGYGTTFVITLPAVPRHGEAGPKTITGAGD